MTLYRRLPTPEATKHQQNRAFSQTSPYLNLTQVEAKQRNETTRRNRVEKTTRRNPVEKTVWIRIQNVIAK